MKSIVRIATPADGACVAALACAPALAQETSNSVRAGLYSVFYHSTASDISGPFVPAGLNLKAKNVNTLYLAYVRSLTSYLDLELTAGWPPKSEVEGKGPATVGSVPYNGQVLSSAKWIAPSVLLEYVFLPPTSALRPFIGAGFNYTHFAARRSTAAGDAVSGGPTAVSLSDSFGPAGTIGVNYKLQANWSLHASYSIARVKTNASLTTGGLVRTTTIDFHPSTLVVSVGYDF